MSEARVDLWSHRAMVLGPLGRARAHAHAATVLLYGIDGHFSLRETRTHHVYRQLRHAIVPYGCRHELECGLTTMAVIMLSPGRSDHCQFCASHGIASDGRVVIQPPSLTTLEQLAAILGGELDEVSVDRFLDDALGSTPEHHTSDVRITQVSRMISETPEAQFPLSVLARGVNLSPSRLQHLFREQMGITPRGLRTWQRMRQVGRHIGLGSNLTEAAHAVGFTDSAHLSHAFQRTFGLPPSRILTRRCSVHVHDATHKIG